MTIFDGDEIAEVLAAALIGLSDDESVAVTVRLPDGTERAVERAWYEPPSGRLIIELRDVGRPRVDWSRLPLYDEWARFASEREGAWLRQRARRQPLSDITRSDVTDAQPPEESS